MANYLAIPLFFSEVRIEAVKIMENQWQMEVGKWKITKDIQIQEF